MTKERKQAVCKNSGTLNKMKSQFKAKLNNNLKYIKIYWFYFLKSKYYKISCTATMDQDTFYLLFMLSFQESA